MFVFFLPSLSFSVVFAFFQRTFSSIVWRKSSAFSFTLIWAVPVDQMAPMRLAWSFLSAGFPNCAPLSTKQVLRSSLPDDLPHEDHRKPGSRRHCLCVDTLPGGLSASSVRLVVLWVWLFQVDLCCVLAQRAELLSLLGNLVHPSPLLCHAGLLWCNFPCCPHESSESTLWDGCCGPGRLQWSSEERT